MEDRKFVPVGKAKIMMDLIESTVRNYGGLVVGYERNGKIKVEFKDLHSAAAYVTWQKFEDVADFEKGDRPFKGALLVTFQS